MYILGDARCIPALQNAAFDAIIDAFVGAWMLPNDYATITETYSNTLEHHKLRKLLVDALAKTKPRCSLSFLKNVHEKYPTEYLADCLIAFDECQKKGVGLSQEDWRKIERCQYHISLDLDKAGSGEPR